MRRMATNKQLDYVNGLSEVAEKKFQIGTYPYSLFSWGVLNVEYSVNEMVANSEIDFENHVITAGAYYEVDFPDLLIHYGLADTSGGSDTPAYVCIMTEEDFEFPENINDVNALKQYMHTTQFINDFWENELIADDVGCINDTASYIFEVFDDYALKDNQPMIAVEFECQSGEGETITGASDPAGVNVLKANNIVSENIIANYLTIKDAIVSQSFYGTIGAPTSRYTGYFNNLDTKGNLYIRRNGSDSQSCLIEIADTSIMMNEEGDNGLIINAGGDEGRLGLGASTDIILSTEDGNIVLSAEGYIRMLNLPTSDPQVTGALWNDNGVLKISAGQ